MTVTGTVTEPQATLGNHENRLKLLSRSVEDLALTSTQTKTSTKTQTQTKTTSTVPEN